MDVPALKLYKIPILLGGISVISIIISIILLVQSTQTTTPIEFSSDTASQSAEIIVDVEGAVVNPGIYTLPGGSRVEDAIIAAGGVTKDLDTIQCAKTVNRAMKLVDGAKLFIPFMSSSVASNLSAVGNLVSVNAGSQSELDSLPGIGPVTAQKIIDGRPYQSLDELVSKKSISASLYEKLKNNLSL